MHLIIFTVPSSPPQQVDCMALTSQTIKVTWQAPPSSSIHGVLKGFKVFYRPAEDWHGKILCIYIFFAVKTKNDFYI